MNKTNRLIIISMAIALSLLSFMSIYALTINGTERFKTILTKQSIFILTSIFVGIAIGRFRHTFLINISKYLHIGLIITLFCLLMFGQEIRGAKAWIKLGVFTVQPAEFLKITLILLYASSFRYSLSAASRLTYYTLITLLPCILIAFQPDLGMATIIIIFYIVSLFTTVIKRILHATAFVGCFIILSTFLYGFVLKEYHKQRIMGFLESRQSTNFQQFNSIKLISYGGIAGRGLDSLSVYSPLYVPDRHNDFLFSCVGEGLGFIGSCSVLIIFIVLISRLFAISEDIRDEVAAKIVYFSAIYLMIQGFVNISVNLGMLPVIGVNMPFFGYGGSSTLSCYVLLGLVISVLNRRHYSFKS